MRKLDLFLQPEPEVGFNISTDYMDENRKVLNISGPKITIDQQANNTITKFPDGVTVVFYDSLLNITARIYADYAIRFSREQKTLFKDSIHYSSPEGKVLIGSDLIWDEEKKTMKSDTFVQLITTTEQLEGYGFFAQEDFSYYSVEKLTGSVSIGN